MTLGHFIDLARHLAGAPIAGIQVRTARTDGRPVDDIALLELGFEDGSIASIQYLSNGPRAFPKERIEAFFDGRAVRIDNYRRLEAWGLPGLGTRLPQSQDKGHAALAAAFLHAVRAGVAAPIAEAELLEVSEWAVRAAELAAAGGGSA